MLIQVTFLLTTPIKMPILIVKEVINMNEMMNVFPIVLLSVCLVPFKQGKAFLAVIALLSILYFVIANALPVFVALILLILISMITVIKVGETVDAYFDN